MPKRILIVAHDPFLAKTRRALLLSAGYEVALADSDDFAVTSVDRERFDLILIGRNSRLSERALDQRLRERYPQLPVLKITQLNENLSLYASRVTDAEPSHVLAAIKEMLAISISVKSWGTHLPE